MITLFKVHMPETVREPLLETLFCGFIGEGQRVIEFESKLTNFIGSPYPLSLNNCTSAIHLALRLSCVKPGDDVITSPMTCTATNEPIMSFYARIIWADINPKTGNIDPESIRRKITSKTKAILVTHWGGYPCPMDEINEIAQEYGIKVIEDAAHAFGTEYKGRKIGNHSDFVCFSFQAIKHITTVDGGVLFCKDETDYRRGKLLRWYGIDRESPRKDFRCEEDIAEWGYKFHMNDVAATIGIEQLNYIDGILSRNRDNARFYDESLSNINGVELCDYSDECKSAYWQYTILVNDRPSFMEYMNKNGIMVSQVHARNDKHSMFRDFLCDNLPGVDEFTKYMVCIPVGWWVTDEERQYIVDNIRTFYS